MIGVVAYLALIVAIPALLLGHQGQDWPLSWVWRTLRAALAPSRGHTCPCGASEGSDGTPEPQRIPRAPQGRPESSRPSWARTDEEAA